MTFDQTIVLWCIGVPAGVVLVVALISRFLPSTIGRTVFGLGWFAGVAAALVARQGFVWWPEDAWQQSYWLLLAWAIVLPATTGDVAATEDDAGEIAPKSERGWRWLLSGTLACLTAMIVMPSGETWSDTLPLHRGWMVAVTLSCLWNGFAIESMARHGASRWCLLVALAGLGGPVAMAAATYGSLAEWGIAMTSATALAAVAGLIRWPSQAWVVAFPVVAGASIITASARFYTYEDYPSWIYAIALFTPTVVASVDGLVQTKPTWVRVTLSAVTAAAMVGLCVWKTLLVEPAF